MGLLLWIELLTVNSLKKKSNFESFLYILLFQKLMYQLL